MNTIQAYERWASAALEDFIAAHPHPVLVYFLVQGTELMHVEKTGLATIERLVLDSAPLPESSGEWYAVYELRGKPGSPRISVGCSRTCDVRIDDASVSRIHGVFVREGEGWLLRDSYSTAGTAVNDRSLPPGGAAALRSGDRVCFGSVEHLFLESPEFHALLRRLRAA